MTTLLTLKIHKILLHTLYIPAYTADLSKVSETVGHENFHALQRRIDQGYASGLFKQDEQAALDSYFPDNQS